MNKHESRIAALEQNRQRHSGVEVLVIRGGLLLPGENPTFGRVGDMRLERGEDEAFPAFLERISWRWCACAEILKYELLHSVNPNSEPEVA